MASEPQKTHRYVLTAINYFTFLAIPCAALLLVIYTQFTRSTEELVISQHEIHQAVALKLQALASIQASLRLYSSSLEKSEGPLLEGALMEVSLSLSALQRMEGQQDAETIQILTSIERYQELLDRAAERMAKGLPQEQGTNGVAIRLAERLRSTLQLSAYANQRRADKLYAELTDKITLYHRLFIFVSWSLVALLIVMWWRQRVQQRTEKNLRHVASEAKEAVKSRSEFMAVMSHEIRTPLNGVLGMADLLLQTSLSLSQKAYTETIVSSGDSLLAVINDILDLSKIEAGRVELDNVPFALAACIKNNIQLVGVNKSGDVSLSFSVDPGVPELICADKNRLSQILVNLLGNALKFTPSGYVKLHAFMDPHNDNVLHFSISDSGIGIRQEVLPHIFDSFSQADSTITRDFGGTGLGLAITKLLVTLMGGQVAVSSKAGSGSCFDFSINIAKVDPFVAECDGDDVESVPVVSEVRRESVRILVAEDNIVNQKVISKMLKNLHYEHDLAVNGVEAVSKWDKQHYDLILMDLQMPELSGLEATDRILATCVEGKGGVKLCPVIVALTANVLEDDRIRCEQAGMTGFLAKPVKQKDLEDCLNRLLGVSVMSESPSRMG